MIEIRANHIRTLKILLKQSSLLYVATFRSLAAYIHEVSDYYDCLELLILLENEVVSMKILLVCPHRTLQ